VDNRRAAFRGTQHGRMFVVSVRAHRRTCAIPGPATWRNRATDAAPIPAPTSKITKSGLVCEHTLHPAPDGLIALTCNEIHRLFNRLILEPARRLPSPLTWSYWRRRHQHRARTSHYQRRPET
jgi:hypothetical protein